MKKFRILLAAGMIAIVGACTSPLAPENCDETGNQDDEEYTEQCEVKPGGNN